MHSTFRSSIAAVLFLATGVSLAQPEGGLMKLDTDGDGRVSFDEFELPPRHHGPMPFARADADEDGAVTRDEMLNAFAEGREEQEKRMSERFDNLDANGNGEVSREEIRRQMFSQLDADGDGFVSGEEAQAMRGKRQQRRQRGSRAS